MKRSLAPHAKRERIIILLIAMRQMHTNKLQNERVIFFLLRI